MTTEHLNHTNRLTWTQLLRQVAQHHITCNRETLNELKSMWSEFAESIPYRGHNEPTIPVVWPLEWLGYDVDELHENEVLCDDEYHEYTSYIALGEPLGYWNEHLMCRCNHLYGSPDCNGCY